MLRDKNIILGVSGGIAAYKSAQLCRDLLRAGARVRVVMTANACKFVTPLSFEALTGNAVLTSLFPEQAAAQPEHSMEHIDHARWGDLLLVAPATANIIGKFANGLAGDALSTLFLAAKCPVLLAPAMNPQMWAHPAVQDNVRKLRGRDVAFVGPAEGEMACGDVGAGRMAEAPEIIRAVENLLSPPLSVLRGKKVLITAGPTREYLDPVRFISNPSSGKMGFALAEESSRRGAITTLIAGPVALSSNGGVRRIDVESAAEMLQVTAEHWAEQDVLIFSAAVGDFRPHAPARDKIKKTQQRLMLELEPAPDIARTIGAFAGADRTKSRVLVGFAAETENLAENARAKLQSKQLDLIVGNDLRQAGGVFAQSENQATLFLRSGEAIELERMEKSALARVIFDQIEKLYSEQFSMSGKQ